MRGCRAAMKTAIAGSSALGSLSTPSGSWRSAVTSAGTCRAFRRLLRLPALPASNPSPLRVQVRGHGVRRYTALVSRPSLPGVPHCRRRRRRRHQRRRRRRRCCCMPSGRIRRTCTHRALARCHTRTRSHVHAHAYAHAPVYEASARASSPARETSLFERTSRKATRAR